MLLLSIVTGVISGVIASGLFWLFLYYFLSPKIEFSEAICKSKSNDRGCGFIYRIKFHNVSKRTANDAHLKAYIVIPNFRREGTDDIYYVPLGSNHIMEILPVSKPGRVRKIVIINLDKQKFTKIFEERDVHKNLNNYS